MVRVGAAAAAILCVILLWSVVAFIMVVAIMGDCSVDGIRSWPLIDDVDRTTGCMSDASRSAAFVLAPIIALAVSAAIAWCWPSVDHALKRRQHFV